MSATLSVGDGRSPDALDRAKDHLFHWFLEDALSTWFEHGVDWSGGGFFERLNDQAQAHEEPRRTRVVARQIYVFCVAQRMGWSGPADQVIKHGLSFLLNKLKQSDGLYASSVTTDGTVVDANFDLYEQAFALFAMAHAASVCEGLRGELLTHANDLLDALNARYKHPLLGYQESCPPSLPLKANPHMHLFEATLAWEAHNSDGSRWHQLSDELAELALHHLVDRESGALYELFDELWQPLPNKQGLIVEPGHQFEWAWLLMRWGASRHREDALLAAKKMMAIGRRHGVCAQRHVAVNQLNEQFAVTDADAKLWPQTEWIKAWHAASLLSANADALQDAKLETRLAIDGLNQYLSHPFPGLWHEVMMADGSFRPELCRASSFYHIVCSIDTLRSSSL